MYPKLFTPLAIKGKIFSNRIMLTAAVTRLAGEDGQVTEAFVKRYRRIARGGVGSMVIEAAVVQHSRSSFNIRIDEDKWIPEFAKLLAAIRKENAELQIGLQIMHFMKLSRSGWRQRVEDFAEKEILEIPPLFAEGARRAAEAGFDFVEIHMAHFTTLASFLSIGNNRRDRYGGDFHGRVLLPLMVVRAIRDKLGTNFLAGVRINGEEFTKNGNTIVHSSRIARIMAAEGIDYISVSAGERFEDALAPTEGQPPRPGTGYSGTRMSPRWWNPDGCQVHLAEHIRHALRDGGYRLPVITAGKIRTPEFGEKILAEKKADIIGIARGLFADPDWPQKALAGRSDDIVLCAACGYCSESDDRMETVRCIQWPPTALHPPDPWRHLPPCQAACPAEVNVRGYMELALQGEYGRALRLIKRKIALPGVISRICPAFCEKKCNRAYFDEAIDINAVKRIIVDKAGLENEIVKPAACTQDMQVAVVGSGPAGLSAAYYLTEKGYGVTVFEALPIPGGMLAVGISEKRLPRQIVETEIDNLQRFGVEIRLNQPVGNGSLSIQQLKNRGYQAVFLATGAPRKRKMKHHRVPSRQLEIPHWSDADLKRLGLYKNGPQGVHAEGLRTKREGVFAGGDLVLGPGTVVQALAHGRCAADNIDRYLNGLPVRPADTGPTTISYGEVDISHFKKRPRLKPAMIAARRGKSPALTSDLLAVQWEAERCFKCGLFPRIKSKAG